MSIPNQAIADSSVGFRLAVRTIPSKYLPNYLIDSRCGQFLKFTADLIDQFFKPLSHTF
jgi:hypothetical protein